MKKSLIILIVIVVIILGVYSWVKGNYNRMVVMDENVKEKWSQVENVYQRRMDLIPNLVNTVKGYAEHEQETFTQVTEARAKVGGMVNIDESVLNDPAMFAKFQQAQSQLGSALQRLMVVQEQYPDLKANQNFLQLQSQLEGTENRIAVERRRFNEAARVYNSFIRIFPTNMLANMFGFNAKPYFQAAAGADTAPTVEF
ncbi:MAG: LemA family protein [Candidatus Stygibacter australis]|nr:LemA family protein [Candidatus Stygibacter australis]MDP8323391.1 LemA family protein [Candidatus Stygibacter australis]